jgi:hypothetical protein
MTFQFLCPQGHLLQGEEWQAGQQSICPICQSAFLVPSAVPPGGPAGGLMGPGVGGGAPPTGGIAYPPTWGALAPPTQTYGPGEGAVVLSAPVSDQPAFSPAGPLEQPVGGFGGIAPPSGGECWQETGQQPGPPNLSPPSPEAPPVSPQQPPVHVFCPSGHELETPRDMLGEDALCPFCGVQFRLRWEHTREYRREKELERERRLARQSKLWLQWSIAAAVVVIVALIIMIAIAASH